VAVSGQRAKPPVHTCRPQVASDRRCSSYAFSRAAGSCLADQVRWRAATTCVPVQLAGAAYGLAGGQCLHGHAALLPCCWSGRSGMV